MSAEPEFDIEGFESYSAKVNALFSVAGYAAALEILSKTDPAIALRLLRGMFNRISAELINDRLLTATTPTLIAVLLLEAYFKKSGDWPAMQRDMVATVLEVSHQSPARVDGIVAKLRDALIERARETPL